MSFSGEVVHQVVCTANSLLQKINAWTISNSLVINADETKAALFRSRNTICSFTLVVSLGGRYIDFLPNVKVLGFFYLTST